MSDDEGSSTIEHIEPIDQAPEVEVRVSDNNILLKVHCTRRKGVLAKLLGTVETLNLTVVSSSVTTFGNSSLNITIIAEMEKEFSSTVKDLVTALRASLL